MSTEEEKGIHSRAEEFLQIFKKGAEFTHELMKENERLRFRVLELEAAQRECALTEEAEKEKLRLVKRIEELEAEKEEILGRIKYIEAENQDFATRYVEIEHENNNLANLYIASYQLHSTLDSREVLQIIIEIIINLIGGEEFALMLLDEKANELQAVASEGIDRNEVPPVKIGTGIIGQVAKTGENYFVEEVSSYVPDLLNPMVCIPLKIKEHVIGVLVIYKLLVQKSSFTELDYELFTLLAGHAATAVFSSRLYSDSERKLSTIQGFLDLLTK
ncbi:MAG TPA: GAF domain-containing protein [Geobacteraceae bacterium]|nr:GAF domain-containing protein [Geobacteraceae bacterium]